jgi:hypothetical protein
MAQYLETCPIIGDRGVPTKRETHLYRFRRHELVQRISALMPQHMLTDQHAHANVDFYRCSTHDGKRETPASSLSSRRQKHARHHHRDPYTRHKIIYLQTSHSRRSDSNASRTVMSVLVWDIQRCTPSAYVVVQKNRAKIVPYLLRDFREQKTHPCPPHTPPVRVYCQCKKQAPAGKTKASCFGTPKKFANKNRYRSGSAKKKKN